MGTVLDVTKVVRENRPRWHVTETCPLTTFCGTVRGQFFIFALLNRQLPARAVHSEDRAGDHLVGDHLPPHQCLHRMLEESPQGSCAVQRVVAVLDDERLRRRLRPAEAKFEGDLLTV